MSLTVNRSLSTPAHGAEVDTWDQPLNGNFGLLDTIVGGVASVSITGGSTVLNAAQLACGTISVSGALVSQAQLDFPAVQGWWSIENLTTGSFTVAIRSGTFTEVICVPPGEITDIQVNGNVVKFRNLGRVGSYIDLSVSSVPSWISLCTKPPYLNCDGSTFNATTYPYLNSALGGNTLPDLRGRSRAYLNQGTGRLTTAGGVNGDVLLSGGGVQSRNIDQSQLPNVGIPVATSGSVTVVTSDGGIVNAGIQHNVGINSGPFSYDLMSPGSAGAAFRSSGGFNSMTGSTSSLSGGVAQLALPVVQPTAIGGLTLIRAA